MKPQAIYVRTEKGAAEVVRRSQDISARARSLLLLVDGKSTGAELLEKFAAFPNSSDLLQLLEDGGYIDGLEPEVEGRYGGDAPSDFSELSVPPDDVAPECLAAAKRQFLLSLDKALGPDAGPLAERVVRAADSRELRDLASKFRDILIEVGGQRSGDSFWWHFEQSLKPPSQ